MKKIVFCLYLMVMVFSMFILSNMAFATNWVYSRKDVLEFGTFYVDADSVTRNGDRLIYWYCFVFNEPMGGVKKEIYREEVDLNTRQIRDLEFFQYDLNNQETYHKSDSSPWRQYAKGDGFDHDSTVALKYAKEGQDTGQKPTP